jgi:hypothetical protein
MEFGKCVFSQTDTTDLILFLVTHQLYALISQIYFGKKLHISDSSSVHHQEFFTVHTAIVGLRGSAVG